MKKIREIWQPYMLRPMLYSVFTKFVCSLCVVLLWDRFVNSRNTTPYSVTEFAFFIMTLYFLVWAWVQYLVLDGLKYDVFDKISELFQKKVPHYQRDMVDFVTEKVITFDMLDDDEQTVAKLGSNVLTAVCYFVPCMIALLL